jgi:hypothetical protein
VLVVLVPQLAQHKPPAAEAHTHKDAQSANAHLLDN